MLDIERLKGEKIYIMGHKRPDADSIFSSILLRNILRKMGVEAEFAVVEEEYTFAQEDADLINTYIQEQPVKITRKEIPHKKWILVDHNDPIQSIGEGNIMAAIDHHIDCKKVEPCYTEEYTSTALYLYVMFKECYTFNDFEKTLIALSVITDSEYVTSSRFSEKDRQLYETLQIDLDVQALRKQYFKTTDFSKTVKENYETNYKLYEMNQQQFHRCMIKAYEKDKVHKQAYVQHLHSLEGVWLLIWCEYDTNKSYVYWKTEEAIEELQYDRITSSSVQLIQERLQNKS